MNDWIDNAYVAMTAQPYFWLWTEGDGRESMPVVVYGLQQSYINRPVPWLYSYVVLPQ
jgi:hypothetical protein